MDYMLWVWLILAAVMLIGEMLTAGFFLIVFGIGAIGSAIVTAFGGGQVVQWVVFIVVSAAVFAGSRRFAAKMHENVTDESVGADRYVGRRANVTEAIDNAHASGMVRVEREEWRAESEDDSKIPAGTRVEIVKVDGAHLIVKQISVPDTHQEA